MDEIVKRLHEQKQIEKAKAILESEGYEVRMNEAGEEDSIQDRRALMTENPTFKKMDALCQAHGYRLRSAYVEVYKSGSKYPYISIDKVEKYHPEIYYNNDLWGKKASFFEIQTTAYGALKKEEYTEFLKGCNDAYDLVSELEKIDLETLAQHENDEEY